MGTSPVATAFTQSVEPGRGTISMSSPSCLNQPIFMATANGDPTPMLIVRAQMATRSLVVWASAAAGAQRTSTARTMAALRMDALDLLSGQVGSPNNDDIRVPSCRAVISSSEDLREQAEVPRGVQEDAGPAQHPMDRAVDVLLALERLVPGRVRALGGGPRA